MIIQRVMMFNCFTLEIYSSWYPLIPGYLPLGSLYTVHYYVYLRVLFVCT